MVGDTKISFPFTVQYEATSSCRLVGIVPDRTHSNCASTTPSLSPTFVSVNSVNKEFLIYVFGNVNGLLAKNIPGLVV